MNQEYYEWLEDPIAQHENRKFYLEVEKKRNHLPHPFTTDPQDFLTALHRTTYDH
jgi:hypothetical protein